MMIPSLLYHGGQPHGKEFAENSETLTADLNLKKIFAAMANSDPFIHHVAKEMMLAKNNIDVETIRFRQEILSDSLQNKAAILNLYKELSKSIESYETYFKNSLPSFSTFLSASAVAKDCVVLFRILLDCIRKVKGIIAQNKLSFCSQAVCRYFEAFGGFFSEEFLVGAQEQLYEIEQACESSYARFTAGLGGGLKGNNYVLRSIRENNRRSNGSYGPVKNSEIQLSSIGIHAQAGRLRDAGLSQVSRMLKEVNEKTLAYLKSFRFDVGFYSGCIHLFQALQGIAVPVAFPDPRDKKSRSLAFSNLVDISLAIENSRCPVGNTLDLDDCTLIIVTGANQGGKSTFLRSVGCAQLMMQCGMFVSAESFHANCCSTVQAHFCRSESARPDQGRLHEELHRMNGIVEHIDRDSLVLMNESLSTTSEREASHIAQEVIRAFTDMGIKTIYVTHFIEFAKIMEEKKPDGIKLLVAQRNADGTRPYTLIPSSPKQTSYGLDIYDEIFGVCR